MSRKLSVFLSMLLLLVSILSDHALKNADSEVHSIKSAYSQFEIHSDALKKLRDFAGYGDGPVELIVGLNDKVPDNKAKVEALATKHDGKITSTVILKGKNVAIVVRVSRKQADLFIPEVEAAGLSSYVEPNYKFKALMVPHDVGWIRQWGPQKIEADWAWNTTVGSKDVLVAVVDTGIQYYHPDIAANYAYSGYDWVNNDSDPDDDHWHGTHCAGIIAAGLSNVIGVAGLAQVRVMAEKVLDDQGAGHASAIANGIIHATDVGADIISMSFGDYFYSETLYNAIKYAYDHGVLLVAAAGNEATSGTLYPAYFKEVIAVAATDQNDTPASFSNFGTWVELAAPGVDIYSTIPYNDYRFESGTSMAAPHVAGVAALIWSRFPQFTRDHVRIHLRKTADDLGYSGFDIHYGYGRINARKAVEQSPPQHDLLVLDWERPSYMKAGNVTINATIFNYGSSNENNVNVQLWTNNSLLTSKSIGYIQSGTSATARFSWPAPSTGVHNITIYVVPVPGEANIQDNAVYAYVGTEQGIIKVPDFYPTIQEAVDAADSADTIRVSSGTYNEAVHVRKANLNLIGESRETTVINGSADRGIWVVYAIDADNFRISEFTLQNSGRGGFEGPERTYYVHAGIGLFDGSDNCIISNNIMLNNNEGIYIGKSYNNTIASNNITLSTDVGILLLFYGAGNLINRNTIESSKNAGIGLYKFEGGMGDTGGDIAKNNIVRGNGYGIDIGLNSLVTGNKVVDNANSGIYLYGEKGITVRDNHFRGNGIGIDISYAYGNSIYRNNFINNTDQVYGTSLNTWHGRWNVTGNYWSDYTGIDSNSDGIGDASYFIDANNKDDSPLMKPYLSGDVNNDGRVEGKDNAIVSKAYGSYPGRPEWNPRADLNEGASVEGKDWAMVCANYGKSWETYWGEY